jgi:hypothetical protein
MDVSQIRMAMRADAIPANSAGMWSIIKHSKSLIHRNYQDKQGLSLDHDIYTFLYHPTIASLHREFGEVVMEDTPNELSTHMNFILKAKGEVLVSGLGLGCVVRGLLCNPAVEKITVVERDQRIIDMVWPHMPKDDRLHLIHDCAIKYAGYKDRYDMAWHDIWSADDEEPLQINHGTIMKGHIGSVISQGAWGMQRKVLKVLKSQPWWYEQGLVR